MKVEREVIIDLLPAYFSGEASAATRALVEEYFRQDPEFEKRARRAGGPLDVLKSPAAATIDPEKERLALERARLVVETRSSFLGMAVLFTVMMLLFRVQDHKIIWVFWDGSPLRGIVISAVAGFLWLLYFLMRGRKDPIPERTKFLWVAILFSLLPLVFTIKDHKIIWLFSSDPEAAFIMGGGGLVYWFLYGYHRWRVRKGGV